MSCSEPTIEGLYKLLPNSLPSVGIFAAEGGQFIGGHGMEDDAKLRTAAGLSAFWDGETIKRVRALDGVTILPGRRLTLHLMAQPDVAAIWFDDPLLIDQGLLSRVLPTAPAAASGKRFWQEAPPESDTAIKQYGTRLLAILERPFPLVQGTRNELAPRALLLSDSARQMWIAYCDHIEKEIAPGGEFEPVRGLANKLPEHAARIAAVLTLVNNIDAGAIAGAEMGAGTELADHYVSEALRLFGASRVNPNLHLAQRLLTWLLTAWEEPNISLPDVYQYGPNAVRDKTTAARIVGTLEEHGWVVRIEGGAEVGSQHRKEAWRIVREA